jgi:uncharacterized protein with PIN domain
VKTERLVADAMLGSLARKLRVFGFDTVYYREGSDSELLEMAVDEGRLILTSDRGLFERAGRTGVPSILIRGSNDGERIRCLSGALRADGIELVRGESRCAVCGRVLERLARSGVAGRVPDGVARSHRDFFSCPGCRKLYWKGRQWTRLRRLSSILEGR